MSTDAKGDDTNRESSESKQNVEVHSANSWETADLGDEKRNEKFLRLMGAGKKEHHGKLVIGDQKPAHKRERKDDQQLSEDLEEQFEQSLEHRLAGGRRGHLGLGYHPESHPEFTPKTDEDPDVPAKEEQGEERDKEDEEEETTQEEGASNAADDGGDAERNDDDESREKDERKRESLDNNADDEPDVKKMKFVKSSS